MKLYAKIQASRGGREAVKGDDIQLNLYLSQGNKKEYYIGYTSEGIMVYKNGIIICDTISKCKYCHECVNGIVQVHHHYEDEKKGKTQKGNQLENNFFDKIYLD